MALVWNDRDSEGSPFLRDYEALLLGLGADYTEAAHTRTDEAAIGRFFGGGEVEVHEAANAQHFDRAGFEGRALSSSYTPQAGDPRHEGFMRGLGEIFEGHQRGGRVTFAYRTILYLGRFVSIE